MKAIKIIAGLFLLYSISKEYVSASIQLGTVFPPSILFAALTLAFLSAWLIGSALSKDKFKFKSLLFIKSYAGAVLVFLLFTLYGFSSHQPPEDYVEVNNIKVPIGRCIEGNRQIIKDTLEIKTYCSCIGEKLAGSEIILQKYRAELESGKLDKIIEAVKIDSSLASTGIENCLRAATSMEWTDHIEKTMKAEIKQKLTGTDLSKTNDIDIYCDCLVNEYKKYPLQEVISENFDNDKIQKADSLCKIKSSKYDL